MKRLAALFAVIALLMAGCRADVSLLLDITDDGSGTLAAEVGINGQLKDLIDQLAGDSEAIISNLDLGLDGEASTRTEGEMTIYRTEVAFDNETEIDQAAAGNFTAFNLEITDEGTSLEATLDVVGELDLTQFAVAPSSIDPETLEGHILVSLPGEIADHNADLVTTDGRLSWTIPLDSELYMYANTVYPKASFPWWIVLLLGLSITLAVAVWLAAVRREKKTAQAQREAPQPPPVDGPSATGGRGRLKRESRRHSPFFDIDE
jgi:membrane protein implicated in regulation of membrane protease activity